VDDIRDVVIIAALIGLSLMLALFTLVLAFAGYKMVRILRRVRRLSDARLMTLIDSAHERLSDWNERETRAGSGIAAAAGFGVRWIRRRRRRKKKRRFAVLDLLRR
jgi:hypothetical protein